MKQNGTRHAAILIIFLFIVAWLINGNKLQHELIGNLSLGSWQFPRFSAANDQTKTGTIILNDHEWQGISCFDVTKQMHGHMITKDVWWQMRLDKSDNRVYTLHPASIHPDDRIACPDTNGCNIMEWRVKPGQEITQATLVWTIEPVIQLENQSVPTVLPSVKESNLLPSPTSSGHAWPAGIFVTETHNVPSGLSHAPDGDGWYTWNHTIHPGEDVEFVFDYGWTLAFEANAPATVLEQAFKMPDGTYMPVSNQNTGGVAFRFRIKPGIERNVNIHFTATPPR